MATENWKDMMIIDNYKEYDIIFYLIEFQLMLDSLF